MTRDGLLLFALLLAPMLLIPGCGAEPEPSAKEYRERGDAAFTAADQLMEKWSSEGTPTAGTNPNMLREEAVLAYVEAGNDFIRAFRLEEADPGRAQHRAMLAFRIGRALSNAARHGVTHPRRDRLATRAVFWFGEAEALEPTLHFATYERAVLHESEIASVRDLVRARDAYAEFLDTAPGAASISEMGRLLTRAGARHAALEQLLGKGSGD